MNGYEIAGRQKKVDALVTSLLYVIKQFGLTVDEVRAGSDDDWALAAKLANVKLPSEQTRRMVIDELAARQADAA